MDKAILEAGKESRALLWITGMDEAAGNTLSATTLIPSVPSFCDFHVLFSLDKNPPDKSIVLCVKILVQQR